MVVPQGLHDLAADVVVAVVHEDLVLVGLGGGVGELDIVLVALHPLYISILI